MSAGAKREELPDFDALRRATPARLGVGRAGPHYTTAAWLAMRADHARAVDAVWTEVPSTWAGRNGLVEIRSRATSRSEYMLRPELGRRLADDDRRKLRSLAAGKRAGAAKPGVLICVGDGLSSAAVIANAAPLVRALKARLAKRYRLLAPLFIRNARVRIEDQIGEILRPEVICMLVGERPGLVCSESLSAYVLYHPRLASAEPDRTVISNIHPGGVGIREAAARIARLVDDQVAYRASGARLAQLLDSKLTRP